MIGLQAACAHTFQEALKAFSIESCLATAEELGQRAFSGYIFRIEESTAALVEAIRSSPQPGGAPLIGVAPPDSDKRYIAGLRLNAVLKEPVQTADAVRTIRAAHLLFLHGMRRHIRVPIVLEVAIELSGGIALYGLSRDLSYGGMSVSTKVVIYPDKKVQVAFSLPGEDVITLQGTVVWRHNPEIIGVRFAQDDEQRTAVRKWIDRYLNAE